MFWRRWESVYYYNSEWPVRERDGRQLAERDQHRPRRKISPSRGLTSVPACSEWHAREREARRAMSDETTVHGACL